jgi:hypothetical protein
MASSATVPTTPTSMKVLLALITEGAAAIERQAEGNSRDHSRLENEHFRRKAPFFL